MNPYDFVPVDWNTEPERYSPSLHDKFDGISGKIEGTITAETPIFIFDSPRKNSGMRPFITNRQGKHIIPGSSLKGLFRNLVETIGNGCFLLFDGSYTRERRVNGQRQTQTVKYHDQLQDSFKKCKSADSLCIACQMFGMIQDSNQDSNLLGKISFNDALEVKICEHEGISVIPLMSPQPHHRAFYLSRSQKRIAGRKFYFHQPEKIQYANQKSRFNQRIKPIDKGSQFAFSVQFTNLKTIELQTLLYALNLESNMRHKLGYGKPAGLGSVHFDITKLTLIDYVNRYTANQGTTVYKNSALATELSKQMHRFTTDKKSTALNALRRIWRWDPNDKTVYNYPNQGWFNKESNKQKRIKDTP